MACRHGSNRQRSGQRGETLLQYVVSINEGELVLVTLQQCQSRCSKVGSVRNSRECPKLDSEGRETDSTARMLFIALGFILLK